VETLREAADLLVVAVAAPVTSVRRNLHRTAALAALTADSPPSACSAQRANSSVKHRTTPMALAMAR
jgi:hypothetical protein